jgi:hypothetical protein
MNRPQPAVEDQQKIPTHVTMSTDRTLIERNTQAVLAPGDLTFFWSRVGGDGKTVHEETDVEQTGEEQWRSTGPIPIDTDYYELHIGRSFQDRSPKGLSGAFVKVAPPGQAMSRAHGLVSDPIGVWESDDDPPPVEEEKS